MGGNVKPEAITLMAEACRELLIGRALVMVDYIDVEPPTVTVPAKLTGVNTGVIGGKSYVLLDVGGSVANQPAWSQCWLMPYERSIKGYLVDGDKRVVWTVLTVIEPLTASAQARWCEYNQTIRLIG